MTTCSFKPVGWKDVALPSTFPLLDLIIISSWTLISKVVGIERLFLLKLLLVITLLITFKATDSSTLTCLCNKCGTTRQLVAVIDLQASKTSVECFKPFLLWHPTPDVFGISIAVASVANAFAGGASARDASADGTPAAGVITATDTSPATDGFSVTDASPTVDVSFAVASFIADTYKMYLKRRQCKKKYKK